MADEPITYQETIDGGIDIRDLSDVVTTTGTVITRLGLPVKTLSDTMEELGTLNDRGAWSAVGGDYFIKDLAEDGGIVYICIISHTPTVFATDLAAGKWTIHQTKTPEVLLSSYPSLAAAIAGIGPTQVNLVIDKDDVLTANLAIGSNINLRFVRGNVITTAVYDLTHSGYIDAGKYPLFDTLGGGRVNGTVKVASVYPEWFGALSDLSNDDTDALNQASVLAASVGSKLVLGRGYLVTQWVIPSGLHFEGLSANSDDRVTIIRQSTGQTISAVKAVGADFSTKVQYIVGVGGIRIEGIDEPNNSIGFEMANASFVNIDFVEVSHFNKGFELRQVNDSRIGFLVSRNCVEGGGIIAGDDVGAPEDNSNNLVFGTVHIETWGNYGLNIVGTGSGAGSNNRIAFQRLKIESAAPSATATHGLKINHGTLIDLGLLDIATPNTSPGVSFVPMIVTNSIGIHTSLMEVYDASSTQFDTLINVDNTRGMQLTFTYFIGVDVVGDLVTIDNVDCQNITIRLLDDKNAIGSTVSNSTADSVMVWEDAQKINSDIQLSKDGETSLSFERTGISAKFQLGRIDGNGTFKIFYNGSEFLNIKNTGEIIQKSDADYENRGAGKGYVCTTPDGTKRYRIAIDNSGNITTTQVA